MRAVITGPTGAIGVALIQECIKHKTEVLAICRKGSRRKNNIPSSPLVEIAECDLCGLKDFKASLHKKYDVFYHFAWDGTFGNARNNMQEQLKNVKYTLDAVELADALGCKTFIGAGSQAEYGRVEGDLSASTPVFPENGYGIAKLCAGQMSRLMCEQKGISHIWARILSVYGPYDGPYTMVMSTIRSLLEKKRPQFTLGGQKWDYLYSKDAAYAMYLLAKKGKSGQVYCLGSGHARPLADYIYEIRDHVDPACELGMGAIPYSEKQVMYLRADISQLMHDTGFKPQYSFQEGIQETIEWVRDGLESERSSI